MIPPVKKAVTPRTGLVDALAPPTSVAPSPLSLQNTSTPVGAVSSVSKEVKKSQLKDRMLSTTPQQPIARQEATNSVHHRSDSAPNLSSGRPEKIRSEVTVATIRSDNGMGAVKSESTKHRQRPDSTCSAARTEIHHITKDPSKANFRQNDIFNSSNHSRVSDSIQTNNSRSDHSNDVKPRSESSISKVNTVQVRSDLGIMKNESSHSSRPNKIDSIKPRHDPTSIVREKETTKPSRSDSITSSESKSCSVLRVTEGNKQSRSENITSTETKNRFDLAQSVPKVESTQNKIEVLQSDVSSASSSKSGKSSKATPTLGPSLANSLASFVDSGLRWTESSGVLDLSEDQQQQSRPPSKAAEPIRVESHPIKESIPKDKVEETEDQESLLQRDLAMVLEEISQITRLVEGKDPSQQQPPQMTKSSESRTKSVIKTTGSLSTSQSSASTPTPTLASNPPSRPLTTTGSAHPPKLTAATRTPPPPQIVSTSVSRITSSPTGANTSINLISPTQTHSSRTISPVSSDHLKSGKLIFIQQLHARLT